MKILVLFSFLILAGCSKHKDPGFASAEGKWTYTTPDSKIAVTFELAKSAGSGLTIQNQTFALEGTQYQSASLISGVSLPSILKIRVNANDSKITYPYNIEFNTGTVSSDFTTITFATATYTWPWGTTLNLTSVKVTRP